MKINEIIVESEQLEEGWKQNIAAAALAAGAALGGGYSGDATASDNGRPVTGFSQSSADQTGKSVSPKKLRYSTEPSYVYPDGNEYFGPLKNGKPNGKGTRIYTNGNFEGEFVNGEAEGKGKLTITKTLPGYGFQKGDVIEGEFRNSSGGLSNVTVIFVNGDKYIGQVKGFSPHGKGTLEFYDGYKYTGEWKDGRFEKGTKIYPNGSKYVGEFKDDEFNGKGTFTTAHDNMKYVGEFKDGEFHGQGKLTLANGDSYFGEFSDSKYNGRGVLTKADGKTESGIWKDGKLQPPEMKFSDGTKYVGQIKNGMPNGEGIFTYSNGEEYSGDVVNGKRHGNGTYTFKDGSKYSGQFDNNQFNGKGKLILTSGTKYFGEFKDGNKQGHFVVNYANGDKYEGGMSDNKRNGQGTYTYAYGAENTGIWKDGKLEPKTEPSAQKQSTSSNTVPPEQAREQAQAKEKAMLIKQIKMLSDESEEKLQDETIQSLQKKLNNAYERASLINK